MAKQTGAIALIAQLERLFVQDPNASTDKAYEHQVVWVPPTLPDTAKNILAALK
jgi:hypothetical protein